MGNQQISVTLIAATFVIFSRAIIVATDDDDAGNYRQQREFRSVVATPDHARVLQIGQQPGTDDDQPQAAETPYQFIYSAGRFPYNVDRTHSETKDDKGTTRGAYSYVDPNRKLQTVRYEANKKEGFKVLSSTLDTTGVQDTQAVALAKTNHRALFDHIAREHARIGEEHARLAAERAKDDDDAADKYDDTRAHLRSIDSYSQTHKKSDYGARLYSSADD